MAAHKIKIYDFPDSFEDEEEAKVMRQQKSRVPFAIVGAHTAIEINERNTHGRHEWDTAKGKALKT